MEYKQVYVAHGHAVFFKDFRDRLRDPFIGECENLKAVHCHFICAHGFPSIAAQARIWPYYAVKSLAVCAKRKAQNSVNIAL